MANQSINDILVRELSSTDIPILVEAFAKANWPKSRTLFEQYLKRTEEGFAQAWVAYVGEHCAGYVILNKVSQYEPFIAEGIPEIKDLNVLPDFRNLGVGSHLMAIAEHHAALMGDKVGIGVGLYADYGAAQRLYINRGYVPDGRGVTYDYQAVKPGSTVLLDDDLVLWFTKAIDNI